MLNEKWNPVFENEELAMKIIPLQPEEAQKVLAENGFDFTVDEILDAGKELYAIREQQTEGELSENDLEEVAGGINILVVKTICRCAGAAMIHW